MPRPRSLTSADLSSAALAVIDRGGLSALTMRAVAKELGMATMALYRYVADRDALEALVVEQILGGIDTSTPADADWRTRLAILLDRMRAAVAAHPATAPLVPRHRHASAAALRWMDATLAALADGGFEGRERVIAQRTLVAFLLGYLENEHYAAIGGAGTAVIATIAPERYPYLVAAATQARDTSPEEEFRGGVEILLRGLTER
ncbi:putative transcriptional regulator, TetR family [Nocardia nova SH22a]|uniref:Putative transcriptional regulator, TetR family n=1 Tax=Nocardia nova SH22a TaxID=1415166 RepID=W5TSU9_9NOCA|nr:TetR/AcrR family transcriptional regulator [Nocardia nova]AHH20311.1 putative transcriptional regulator, TetR family [Nocardia nova SH22a]